MGDTFSTCWHNTFFLHIVTYLLRVNSQNNLKNNHHRIIASQRILSGNLTNLYEFIYFIRLFIAHNYWPTIIYKILYLCEYYVSNMLLFIKYSFLSLGNIFLQLRKTRRGHTIPTFLVNFHNYFIQSKLKLTIIYFLYKLIYNLPYQNETCQLFILIIFVQTNWKTYGSLLDPTIGISFVYWHNIAFALKTTIVKSTELQ